MTLIVPNLPEVSPKADPFRDFLLKNAANKKYLLIALAGTLAQFVLFKICYPYADYFNDSYTYINAAAQHHVISFRPIGYSRFLEMVHFFTVSDTALVFIQYFSVQMSSLLLFFTVCYFFPVRKTIRHLLFAVLIFNPIILYITNYVSSDAIFISLSLLWITQLLWIINRPAWYHLIVQAILLLLIFKMRYAALYLPVITVFAILLSRKKWFFQLAGLALTIVPLLIEVKRIEYITEKETGTRVFSAFSGWVTVSNALSIYPYVNMTDNDFASADCRTFHAMVKKYFDTLPPSKRASEISTFALLWGRHTPMKNYMRYNQIQKKVGGYFNAWHAVGPVFSEYGQTLIKKHPLAYATHFMLPNVKNFVVPQLESLAAYNEGRETIDAAAAQWFSYKSSQINSVSKDFQGKLLAPFPYLQGAINILFCLLFIIFLLRARKRSYSSILVRSILFIGFFWSINFLFSIYAIPIVLRFQVFPMIVSVTFLMVLLHYLLPVKQVEAEGVNRLPPQTPALPKYE